MTSSVSSISMPPQLSQMMASCEGITVVSLNQAPPETCSSCSSDSSMPSSFARARISSGLALLSMSTFLSWSVTEYSIVAPYPL